jgi:hypothetical protein
MRPFPADAADSDDEYRAIEGTLLQSARGRWFLAEHGRRARRLDGALLEDAIGRLQLSLRQPPALLGQLQSELHGLKAYLADVHAKLLEKCPEPAEQQTGGVPQQQAHQIILKAAEDIHDVAWALQANPFDPKGCEDIARNAGKLYAMSQAQSLHAARTLEMLSAIGAASDKIDAILETIGHESQVDPTARD